MPLPILTYHSLDQTGSPVSVSPPMFRRHLVALRDAGYTALPLSEALTLARDRPARTASGPRRVVAVTFDDGYAAVHRHALPLLASYGWRATVFPISGYVGRDNAWPGQPAFVPPARLLSWGELTELADAGWEIGAHTRTHPDLTRLADDALADEVAGAKAELEDRLGRPIRAFAYPYGSYDRRVRARVSGAYATACTTVMGVAGRASDRHALERIDMWYFSRPGADRLLASPWMRPYVAACRIGRAVRAGLGRAASHPSAWRTRAPCR